MSKQKKQYTPPVAAPAAEPLEPITAGSRWSALKYIGGFLALFVAFYVVYTSKAFNDFFLQPVVHSQAWLASKILTLCGHPTGADGSQLSGALASLNVQKGCDGMEVTALYLIGVLMVPFTWRSKLIGLGYGLGVLFLLNLVRIIVLYLTQIYWPSAFEFLHLHGGFALFTVVTILMWAHWANWALKRETPTS